MYVNGLVTSEYNKHYVQNNTTSKHTETDYFTPSAAEKHVIDHVVAPVKGSKWTLRICYLNEYEIYKKVRLVADLF